MDPERLPYDPALERCPDFSQPRYQVQRSSLVNDQLHPEIANGEQAIAHLRDAWVAQDEALEHKRREVEEEEERQRQREQRDKEEKDEKEREKKRQTIYSIKMGVGMGADLDMLPKYAKDKAERREIFPYCYTLSSFCREAEEAILGSTGDHGYDLTQEPNSKITFRPSSSSSRPSPKEIVDADLVLPLVLLGKPMFISSLIGYWPNEHIEMFSQFYAKMEAHPELRRLNGKKVMARYHAVARRKFYKAMGDGDPFDISVISPEVLKECRDNVEDKEREKAMSE
ncbi:hypothetical protein PQX77_010384 [Marasmius sp. AFHP31]|nr:hypothetical protein PQX77_010384 [Marasmius sp. AFHP31]